MKISVNYLQVYIPVFLMVLPNDLDCRWNSSKSFLISSILDKRLEKQCWTLQHWFALAINSSSGANKGKKKVYPPFCTRLYNLFSKVYFSEKWFLALFQFMKIRKIREKCFFHSVAFAQVPFTVFFQGVFCSREKENLVIFSTLSKEKLKQIFIITTIIFSKQNET